MKYNSLQVIRVFISVTIVTQALVSCSSGGDLSSQDDDTITPEQHRAYSLAIAISAPPSADSYEIWSCLTETGLPIGYTFHRNGTFGGSAADLLLGKELDPTITLSSEQLRYVWTATSESSLLLDAPDRGVQISWSDININEDGTMTALTSNRGQLLVCGRNTVAKSDVGSPDE
ncbi:hypothetical protein OAM69_00335 [bacterium]|nr:hypothetical protein [bacterium]